MDSTIEFQKAFLSPDILIGFFITKAQGAEYDKTMAVAFTAAGNNFELGWQTTKEKNSYLQNLYLRKMGFKQLRKKKWFKIISNKYVLLLMLFCIWMLFLDSNSWLVHRELNNTMQELEDNKEYYKAQIAKDTAIINSLNDPDELEKFAREKYFMKRENEDIYIIQYADSLKKHGK